MKIVKKIKLKVVIFTAVKNHCILHGRVFVMKLYKLVKLFASGIIMLTRYPKDIMDNTQAS